uniref:Movement protein n=1 Tax=Hymenolepis diminuta TaxID=6216 RepID=A0A0R3SP81_HYMDI
LDTHQQQASQYRRFKWSNLRRKATMTAYATGDLRRTNSLVKEERKYENSQRFNSGLTSPTPTYDDVDIVSATGSSNALGFSASSRTGSIYFDAEDRASAVAVRLDTPTDAKTADWGSHIADIFLPHILRKLRDERRFSRSRSIPTPTSPTHFYGKIHINGRYGLNIVV